MARDPTSNSYRPGATIEGVTAIWDRMRRVRAGLAAAASTASGRHEFSALRTELDHLVALTRANHERVLQAIGGSGDHHLATAWNVTAAVHRDDMIFQFLEERSNNQDPLERYLRTGRSSAELLRALVLAILPLGDPGSSFDLLEFASGYGCVSRHLKNVLPGARVTASDIHPQAMEFIGAELGLDVALSCPDPAAFELGRRFDVVFALSFFSHMPEHSWGQWLAALFRHVGPNGCLIFTTNGRITRDAFWSEVEIPLNGIWFAASSEQRDLDQNEYGSTITSVDYVRRQIDSHLAVPVTFCMEGLWSGHQDTYVVRKAEPTRHMADLGSTSWKSSVPGGRTGRTSSGEEPWSRARTSW